MWQDPTTPVGCRMYFCMVLEACNGVQHAITGSESSPTPAIEVCMWHGLPPILTRQCWTDSAVNFREDTSPHRQLGAPGHLGLNVPRVCGHARAARTRAHTDPDFRDKDLIKRRTPRAERAAHGGALQAGRAKTLRRNCTVGYCHPGYPRPMHQPGRQGARAGAGLGAPLVCRAADRVTFLVTCSAAPSQPEPGQPLHGRTRMSCQKLCAHAAAPRG